MAKINVCDYCEIKLGEMACSNRYGGSYCSIGCADIAEMEEQSKEAPKSTDDIIANLVNRVAQAERDMLELIEIVQKDRRNILDKIDVVKDDIETWAQEVEKTKRELDDKIEMCIDDIVTLDERTQTENLTKFAQRGSRI